MMQTAEESYQAPPSVRRIFSREIPHILSRDEIHDYGKRLARRKVEWDVLDEKRKNVAAQFKGQLAEIGSDVDRLTAAIDSGEEMRTTACYELVEGAHVIVRRADTHEEVDRRPALPSDLQESLPGMEEEDDFNGFNHQVKYEDEPELVTSSAGDIVAHMPDDEGELPSEEPIPPPPAKGKRGRKAKTS